MTKKQAWIRTIEQPEFDILQPTESLGKYVSRIKEYLVDVVQTTESPNGEAGKRSAIISPAKKRAE